MLALFVDAAGEFAPAAAIVVLALAGRRFERAWVLPMVFALFVADALLLDIHSWLPNAPLPSGVWNWQGKIAALLLALSALAVLPATLLSEVGLFAVPPKPAWPRLFTLAAVVCGLALARSIYFGGAEPFSVETLAFQATMPGLHEEMTFRGLWWILFAVALDPGRIAEGKIPWWTLATTTVLFAAVHAIDLTPQGVFKIEWPFFAATAISGVLYGFLQAVGRAVWIPILVHNLANTLIYAWQMSQHA